MADWPVFLCYRQVDGKATAEWLYKQLHNERIPTEDNEGPRLDMYFDETAPSVGNWRDVHQPALERARAMLVVCTPGLHSIFQGDDWVHLELDWWLGHRQAAPILIDTTGEGDRWIPESIQRRWPQAQRIEFKLAEWKQDEDETRSAAGRRIVSRIIEGIRHSETETTHEDLRRFKRLSRGLAVSLVLALTFLAVAVFLWFQASNARDAERQRTAELAIVTDFQSSMLGDVDAELMGIRLVRDLRARLRKSFAKEGMSEEELQTVLASFEEFLWSINPTGAALKILDDNILGRAVETIANDFADQPVVRASLLQTVAVTYREIGLYEPAMPLQKAALETRRQILGDDDPDTLTSINNMGILLYSIGKLAEAKPYYREALEGRRRVLGDNHPDTLTSLNDLGTVLMAQGEYTEAEQCFREALEERREALGADHPDTIESIGNMGHLLHLQEKREEAEQYYRRALEGYRRVFGDGDPRTITLINNLTALLREEGKLAEAEGMLREAVRRIRRVLGNDHPLVLVLTFHWGKQLQARGEIDEAERQFHETLVRMRRVLGDAHRDTLTAISDTGILRYAQERYTDAEALFHEALDGHRRELGEYHPNTQLVLGNLVETLKKQGKFAEAEAEMLGAHERLVVMRGADHDGPTRIVKWLITLYDAWHAAEPDQRYDAKAAEWRSKLPGNDPK